MEGRTFTGILLFVKNVGLITLLAITLRIVAVETVFGTELACSTVVILLLPA
jgi:hypothetical protein